jgi:hypothetical protein
VKRNIFSLIIATAFLLFATMQTTVAARPNRPGGTIELVGYDVSFPQCGKRLPEDHVFTIIGINGGNAATGNPCLADQLAWGSRAAGITNQPHLQLYVNTANPGEVISQVQTWPKTNQDPSGYTPANPYANSCSGTNNLSCSWLYGWNRAYAAVHEYFKPAANFARISNVTGDYTWWLDVETMNTWQSGSQAAYQRNVAAIEGWTSYFSQNNAKVGLYSTAYQWGEITGNFISPTSNLNNLPNWRPSGATLTNAKANCSLESLTPGGFISLTQYVKKNLDYNHSCI